MGLFNFKGYVEAKFKLQLTNILIKYAFVNKHEIYMWCQRLVWYLRLEDFSGAARAYYDSPSYYGHVVSYYYILKRPV